MTGAQKDSYSIFCEEEMQRINDERARRVIECNTTGMDLIYVSDIGSFTLNIHGVSFGKNEVKVSSYYGIGYNVSYSTYVSVNKEHGSYVKRLVSCEHQGLHGLQDPILVIEALDTAFYGIYFPFSQTYGRTKTNIIQMTNEEFIGFIKNYAVRPDGSVHINGLMEIAADMESELLRRSLDEITCKKEPTEQKRRL